MTAPADGDGRRLLVAAGAAAPGVDALPLLVRGLLDAASEVLVVSPVTPGRLEWLASDTDRARYQADERLDLVLGQMEEIGVPAAGHVGDDSAMTALADAIRSFRPDHILIALRSRQDAYWQERGLLDRVRHEFALPVTVFVVAEPAA